MESAVIDSSADFDFSELNSEAFKNMMNSAVNDDVGLDESEAAENIHLLKEDELDAVPRITPEMVKRYGNTEFV